MRRFATLVLVVGLMVLAGGCGSSYELSRTVGALTELPEGRVFPREPKFTIQPESVGNDAGLDFAAVYYLDHSTLSGVTSNGGRYLRFWADGRVMLRFTGRKPTAADADQYDGGWLGYYQVKDGNVVIELFAPTPREYRWGYWKIEAEIDRDKLRLIQGERKRKVEAINRTYVKLPLTGMKRTTDW